MKSPSSILCLLLILSDYKGDLTSSILSNIHLALHAFQSSKKKKGLVYCLLFTVLDEGKKIFLFSSGHNPAGNDGVDESFYRRVNSQEKAFRHNIKDNSPAMMKSFFILTPPYTAKHEGLSSRRSIFVIFLLNQLSL